MVYPNRACRNKQTGSRASRLVILAAVIVSSAAGAAMASAADRSRVRSSDPAILALLREGVDRSATFSTLADRVERSSGIVYVEFGYCAFGHLDGCVLPLIASPRGDRYLRILVTPEKSRRSHDQLLALIAHELRHALEVFDDPEVVDVATMYAMYKRIGTPEIGGESGYETSAARSAGNHTLDELLAGRKRIDDAKKDPVGRALSLFSASEIETMPRIVRAAVRPEHVAANVEGYVVPGYPAIYVAVWSDAYKAAENGDHSAIAKLAGIIAHERTHIEQGADERLAYEAEISMLRRCNAPSALVDGVRRAMTAVVSAGVHAAR
jgi:hypothetical protein